MPYRAREQAVRLVCILSTWGAGAAFVTHGTDQLHRVETPQERQERLPWKGVDPDRARPPTGGHPDTTTLLRP